ncbi:MAG TPA: hypothetical protein VES66_10885 [Terriglobales bacterium]|nr:hypothetical protein [Terriglobales bacterium]
MTPANQPRVGRARNACMQLDRNNASPSSPAREGSFRNLLLLILCIVGLLAGLGVFAFVCYLLMQ